MGCGIQRGKQYEKQETDQKVADNNAEKLCLKRKMLYDSIVYERRKINENKICKAPVLYLSTNALYKSRLDRISKICYANNIIISSQ
ncbi:hypothetical protein SteCoe_13346 [Stentor coeruleus]|uniref:Uncharacterized protein n=1 Tax=Stentor coeruleus TaxID=5963 RepID=A0A1R2C8Q7_9CILI|nr:hypothetical protein SteCoe_13346 [Stentor coeruleus]